MKTKQMVRLAAVAVAVACTFSAPGALLYHYTFEEGSAGSTWSPTPPNAGSPNLGTATSGGNLIRNAGSINGGTQPTYSTVTPQASGSLSLFNPNTGSGGSGAVIPSTANNDSEIVAAGVDYSGAFTFTVAAWFQVNTDTPNLFIRFLGKQGAFMLDYRAYPDYGSPTDYAKQFGDIRISMTYEDDTPGSFWISDNNLSQADGDRGFKLNEWVHLAIVYDSTATSSEISAYFDGVLFKQFDLPKKLKSVTNAPFSLGEPGQSSRFPGYIDDIRVYNEALTGAAIANLIPEPSSLALLALAGTALLSRRRR